MPSGGYEDKQQREINAFAAMANGDYDFSSTGIANDNNDSIPNSIASTAGNDISSFAAMANADYDSGTFASDAFSRTTTVTAASTVTSSAPGGSRGSRGSSVASSIDNNLAAAAFRLANSDDEHDKDNNNVVDANDTAPSLSGSSHGKKSQIVDNDQERTAFAAMANAGFDSGTFAREPTSSHRQPVDNSGTFARIETPSSSSSVKKGRPSYPVLNSNLAAAAMALSNDESGDGNGRGAGRDREGVAIGPATFGGTMNVMTTTLTPSTSFGFAHPTKPTNNTLGGFKIPTNKTRMHARQVYLPRPLFFGPNLPPRVVKEARKIVSDALNEQRRIRQKKMQGHSSKATEVSPTVRELPPQVRNLVSTIRCYGYGIDILKSHRDDHDDSNGTMTWKGSSYVSVFCPKWSEERKDSPPSALSMADRSASSETQGTASSADASGSSDSSTLDVSTTAESTQEKVHPSTQAGQSTSSLECTHEKKEALPLTYESSMSDRDLFSMFAKGGGDDPDLASSVRRSSANQTMKRNSISDTASMMPISQSICMTEQDIMFAQWVRGESPANATGGLNTGQLTNGPDGTNTFNFNDSIIEKNAGAGNSVFLDSSGTYTGTYNLTKAMSEDSDDDSLVGSEMKKKVGVNEHLNAALASLEEDDFRQPSGAATNNTAEEAPEMTQVPLTPDGGRPLSNHELMNGHAPLFGVDDPPLPSEADLGNYETREEQQRSKEQKRTQTIIEKLCPQNVFGPLACPNPSLGPDDNLSWNSMIHSVPRGSSDDTQRFPPQTHGARPISRSSSLESDQSYTHSRCRRTSVAASKQSHILADSPVRYGWWNKGDDENGQLATKSVANSQVEDEMADGENDEPFQLPPWEHASSYLQVVTRLEPSPDKLRQQNRGLSDLHPATPLAQALPFLSDRPPSYRYLQVDTQAVGFPALGGEVEPLFCSLAIYHVETVAQGAGDRDSVPRPDLQRCGKVTETLYFDVVSDPDIERRHIKSLSPFSDPGTFSVAPPGTRCGVFPLPSNIDLNNLFAIITVGKVVGEDLDFDPYLRHRPSGEKARAGKMTLETLRKRAESSSRHHGKFVMPFAFGVVPLLQVFGTDVPTLPSSRAVQIPLFKFSAGKGERQIVDHIMVMLYPRANHRAAGIGGPAPVTNGGTAMLVMRNYGYLGLHEVVNGKSSLARDRLVDFTGEVQLRKREEGDEKAEDQVRGIPVSKVPVHDSVEAVPEWRKEYVAEPTRNGGRPKASDVSGGSTVFTSTSTNYAQELAPLPLFSSPQPRGAGPSLPLSKNRERSNASGDDIEPYFHTTFCNELVCHPRILHNCQKGNIAIRVEVRELEWQSEYNAFFAHVPKCGPLVHNSRRGSFLVQETFTSCSSRYSDPHFLDEIKMKLPLVLDSGNQKSFCILFTVFRLSFSARKKWNLRLRASKRNAHKADEIAGEVSGESSDVSMSTTDCRLVQLGCGFLPLEQHQCLLDNGSHDVNIGFTARFPSHKAVSEKGIDPSTLILSEIPEGRSESTSSGDENITEEGDSVSSGKQLIDTASATTLSESQISELTTESKVKGVKRLPPMQLQVRVSVHSSLHTQNTTLNDFFGLEPDTSVPLKASGNGIQNLIRLGKDEILRQLSSPYTSNPSEKRDYDTQRLLIATVDVAKSDMCPTSEVSSHLLRICTQLWKVVVAGTGDHDLEWANPAVIIPLRVHAFASLLQILGSSTIFLSKRGVTQIDGKSKWNFVSLCRTLALHFDEESMFGMEGNEVISPELIDRLTNRKGAKHKEQGKKRSGRTHARSTFEFLNHGAAGGGSGGMSAIIGDEIKSPTSLDDMTILSKPATLSAGARSKSHSSVDSYQKQIPHPLPISRRTASDNSPKVDTVTDFMSALRAASNEGDYNDQIYEGEKTDSSAEVAASWIKAFGGSSGGNRGRFMTAPSGLATIREDGGDGDEEVEGLGDVTAVVSSKTDNMTADPLDSEIIRPKPAPAKQFRRPVLSGSSASSSTPAPDISSAATVFPTVDDGIDFGPVDPRPLLLIPRSNKSVVNKETEKAKRMAKRGQTLPTTDMELEKAGTSFLDAIEKSLGLRPALSSNIQGDEDRAFGRYHRKRVSHSSIDWSIPNDDLSSFLAESAPVTPAGHHDDSIENFDDSMGTLKPEIGSSIKLPSFVDRLAALGNSDVKHGRWFPYVYEIIILQWAAVLVEQQSNMSEVSRDAAKKIQLNEGGEALADAAARTCGAVIACAPVFFELIKQSIGHRVLSFLKNLSGQVEGEIPPLVTLDDTMLANLEQLIAMITDACLDSRNFDAWETRDNSVDVHDSIVCFIRDMFAFLDPNCVYRLAMVYWSRLLSNDGRHYRDRDSMIGLNVSWEIQRLQLAAVSAFVRFPDIIRVNSPQMTNWSDSWATAPALSTISFFDDILDRYIKLGQPSILNQSGNGDRPDLGPMRPHWICEILVDVCLSGIEHVEPEFQLRSSSLLLEMFWSQGQQSLKEGYSSVVASMYVSFIEKVLSRTSYLATCFAPKSNVRQNIILCVVFVLQSAPSGLLRALWRKLFSQSPERGTPERYGGINIPPSSGPNTTAQGQCFRRTTSKDAKRSNSGPAIYDMFSLINVCLATVEYEGSDEHAEISGSNEGPLDYWRREFLMAKEKETMDVSRTRRMMFALKKKSSGSSVGEVDGLEIDEYTTTSSRKWLSHDATIVLIRATQQIVRELRYVLEPIEGAQAFFNPARRKSVDRVHRYQSSFTRIEGQDTSKETESTGLQSFSYSDTIIFVRGATSVYLHSLALKESDIAIVKTLNAAVEIIKIFGIKIFNEAVGETLQHWMRMITFHCGSRRAEVRVPASDFMELLLRSTWDCFGSFFRIRIPLLAVQIEVMERIVATATARHYRDQRRFGSAIDLFSNASAEASLAPLWRTTDRLHHQSASQNHAFRSSLVRLAEKLKKLHRAYIAAHALSFQNRTRSPELGSDEENSAFRGTPEVEAAMRANRICIFRVINASAGYSKQFLGIQTASRENLKLAHNEAVEDAFLEAADVFSPTELPDHRVAWLRRLATFHATRSRYAEEATCHYMVYHTFFRSSRLSDSLWSSTPFLPWIDSKTDGIHNEGPVGDPDDGSDFDRPELDYGRQIEKTNSFRRIFYRNENSIRLNGGDLETGFGKAAFFGVSMTSEYLSSMHWMTHREMEGNMLEEAETAGHLFKKSGIIASSRYMWSLATQYYAEKFMYSKLAIVYDKLARTVVSQVPVIDTTIQQEVNVGVPLGNFFRVWFHGGAPDDLLGAEFVYRSSTNIRLEKFGKELKKVLWGIIPQNTPIYLELDGRPEENVQQNASGFTRMGGVPLEPVKVKVTPLRPVVRNADNIRGLPEWFKLYIDNAFGGQPSSRRAFNLYDSRVSSDDASVGSRSHHHHARSLSASVYSSSGGNVLAIRNMASSTSAPGRHFHSSMAMEGELVGADKFWFMQPIDRDRRGSKDWLKGASGNFAEKTLRVTQLQVRDTFPACVSRQAVVHRVVYTMSPLEAAFDVMCQWCAVLFRTSIASNGAAMLGLNSDPGIGIDAAKVVSECIHSSRVKEMGMMLLKKNDEVEDDDDDFVQSYDRLSDEEVQKFQLKLARSLVVFMELLHLLIAKNRDRLLDVIATRKKRDKEGRDSNSVPLSNPQTSTMRREDSRGSLATLTKPVTRETSLGTAGTNGTFGKSEVDRRNVFRHERRGSEKSLGSLSNDGRSRDEMPTRSSQHVKGRFSSEDPGYTPSSVASGRDGGGHERERDRTDSAIGIQRILQLAFINLAKELYPLIHGIMGRDTPHWLKLCCQENYFSGYLYKHQKIPIGEEFTFEDVNVFSSIDHEETFAGDGRSSHYGDVSRGSGSVGGRIGIAPSLSQSDKSQHVPGSPGGSVVSSASRTSDGGRSAKSLRTYKSQDMRDQQDGIISRKQPLERLGSC